MVSSHMIGMHLHGGGIIRSTVGRRGSRCVLRRESSRGKCGIIGGALGLWLLGQSLPWCFGLHKNPWRVSQVSNLLSLLLQRMKGITQHLRICTCIPKCSNIYSGLITIICVVHQKCSTPIVLVLTLLKMGRYYIAQQCVTIGTC